MEHAPRELISKIIGYFVDALIHIISVCKRWRTIVYEEYVDMIDADHIQPGMKNVRGIYMSCYNVDASVNPISAIVTYNINVNHFTRLTMLCVRDNMHINDEYLSGLTTLTSLDISGCNMVTDVRVLTRLKTLTAESVDFTGISLETLKIGNVDNIDIPTLKCLSLTSWHKAPKLSPTTSLTSLSVCTPEIPYSYVASTRSLKHFDAPRDLPPRFLEGLQLETLCVYSCNPAEYRYLSSMTNLRDLNCDSYELPCICSNLTRLCMVDRHGWVNAHAHELTNLHTLDVYSDVLDDDTLMLFTNLTSLDVAPCDIPISISDNSITKLTSLRYLHIMCFDEHDISIHGLKQLPLVDLRIDSEYLDMNMLKENLNCKINQPDTRYSIMRKQLS